MCGLNVCSAAAIVNVALLVTHVCLQAAMPRVRSSTAQRVRCSIRRTPAGAAAPAAAAGAQPQAVAYAGGCPPAALPAWLPANGLLCFITSPQAQIDPALKCVGADPPFRYRVTITDIPCAPKQVRCQPPRAQPGDNTPCAAALHAPERPALPLGVAAPVALLHRRGMRPGGSASQRVCGCLALPCTCCTFTPVAGHAKIWK